VPYQVYHNLPGIARGQSSARCGKKSVQVWQIERDIHIGLIEKRPRSVYNAAPIKETVPDDFYKFLMKLDNPKEIVKALRLYIDVGDELLKHLPYADSYDTLHACVMSSTVRNVPIKTSVRIVLPDLKRYDSLLKGGDAV